MTTHTTGSAAAGSISALIGELRRRRCRARTDTLVSLKSQVVDAELNPQLLAQSGRVAEIMATLPEHRGICSGEPGAS